MSVLSMVVPLLLCAVALWGSAKRVDVFDALTVGAGEGLQILLRILPSLVALLTQAGGVTGQGVQVENLEGTLTVDALCQDGVISRLYLTGPAVLVYRGWLEDFPE